MLVGPIIYDLDLAHYIVIADSSKYNLRHANYYQFQTRYTRMNILKLSFSSKSSEIMEPFAFTLKKKTTESLKIFKINN